MNLFEPADPVTLDGRKQALPVAGNGGSSVPYMRRQIQPCIVTLTDATTSSGRHHPNNTSERPVGLYPIDARQLIHTWSYAFKILHRDPVGDGQSTHSCQQAWEIRTPSSEQ